MRHNTETWTVGQLVRRQRQINFSPPYQRNGGAWSMARKQLFIDSLFNNFDIPKLYLHRTTDCGLGYDFAVVDGRQRLETILEFLRDDFALAENFVFEGDPLPVGPDPLPNDAFSVLSSEANQLLRDATLDVVIIDADEIEDIEELFSRLNNGEKLTAPEARNAFGGDMNSLVREIADEPFFTSKFGFPNRRYNHLEVACKLLLLESHRNSHSNRVQFTDLKKRHLDNFVKTNKTMTSTSRKKLRESMKKTLKRLEACFDNQSPDLKKQSHPPLMYLFVMTVFERYGSVGPLQGLIRQFLADFRNDLQSNRLLPTASRDPELIEFGRLAQQGTNDADSLRKRVEIMVRRFLASNPDVTVLDQRRRFNDDERAVIWLRAKKRCESCSTKIETLSEMDADHVKRWAQGGLTILLNARCLCKSCNRNVGGRAA